MARPDKFTKARTAKTCDRTSWYAGCGGKIAPGEIYLRYTRGGLSTFALCGSCCNATVNQIELASRVSA